MWHTLWLTAIAVGSLSSDAASALSRDARGADFIRGWYGIFKNVSKPLTQDSAQSIAGYLPREVLEIEMPDFRRRPQAYSARFIRDLVYQRSCADLAKIITAFPWFSECSHSPKSASSEDDEFVEMVARANKHQRYYLRVVERNETLLEAYDAVYKRCIVDKFSKQPKGN